MIRQSTVELIKVYFDCYSVFAFKEAIGYHEPSEDTPASLQIDKDSKSFLIATCVCNIVQTFGLSQRSHEIEQKRLKEDCRSSALKY